MALRTQRVLIFGDSHPRRLRDLILSPQHYVNRARLLLNLGIQNLDIKWEVSGGLDVRRARKDNLPAIRWLARRDWVPSVVILCLGCNDLAPRYRSAPTPRTVADRIVELAEDILSISPRIRAVVLTGLLPRPGGTNRQYNRRATSVNCKLSSAARCHQTRRQGQQILFWAHRGVLRVKEGRFPRNQEAKFSADQVHLSTAGQVLFYNSLKGATKQGLRAVTRSF